MISNQSIARPQFAIRRFPNLLPEVFKMPKKKDAWYQKTVTRLSLREILFSPAVLILMVSAATIGGTIYLWNQNQVAIIDFEDYILTADKIAVSKLQPAGTSDIKQLVASPAEGDRPNSLLDPGLVDQTVQRIKKIGWIESIHGVTKSSSGLQIDLDYRTPIGVVELNQKNVRNWPIDRAELLLPVDRTGVLLPKELANRSLIRFTVFEPLISENAEAWGAIADDRILGCVEISAYLSRHWKEFGFCRITTLRPPIQPSDNLIPFQIWTNTKSTATKVIWGNPPGKEIPGEASAERKLRVLTEILAEYGPLNELAPTVIDVRSGTAVTIDAKTAKTIETGGILIK
jgi:hypothetical protein